MTEAEILDELRRTGAILEGHFVLSSGRHSDTYVEKFRALEQPSLAVALGTEIAARFKDRAVDVVLSPAVGALTLGFTTAMALNARFVFAERVKGTLELRRGFEIADGEHVLVVEDVLTTGRSVGEVVRLVAPGELVGIGVLADRTTEPPSPPMAVEAFVRVNAPSWEPSECPLCAEGAPTTSPGSRHL